MDPKASQSIDPNARSVKPRRSFAKHMGIVAIWFSFVFSVVYIFTNQLIRHFHELNLPKYFEVIAIHTPGEKLTILAHWGYYLAGHVFALVCFVLLYRIGTGKNPVHGTDAPIIRTANRILSNTLESTVIFLGLYGYWLLKHTNASFKEAILFPTIFLVGRLVFSVTYLLGVSIGFHPLRGLGFVMTMLANVFLMLESTTGLPFLLRVFS